MKKQRAIETILDLETGKQYEADDLFLNPREREAEIFQLRTKIEQNIQCKTINHVCIYCKQAIAIRGRKKKGKETYFYFTHLYRSNDCIIKVNSNLTEEQVRCIKYNGVKESLKHLTLKNDIAHFLSLNKNSRVFVEKVYTEKAISRGWRKPDIFVEFSDKKIAIELQLSTTFLSVIVSRTLFYKMRKVFLIWIFPEFSVENDIQKFTQKDVYYNHNFNVYVFDESAKEQSEIENELILKCYYKEAIDLEYRIEDDWKEKFIRLSELSFDFENTDVFYYDFNKTKEKLMQSISHRQAERERIESETKTRKIVAETVSFLRKVYLNNNLLINNNNCLDIIETDDEIQELNNQLKFYSDDKMKFIKELFFNREQFLFLSFIFKQDKIHIDITKLSDKNESILEKISFLPINDFKDKVLLLFRKGYSLTENEINTIKSLNKDSLPRECIEKWTYISFINLISDKERSFDIKKNNLDVKILYAIISLKKGYVIGFNWDNLKQVCNNIFEYRKAYGVIFIKAMRIYDQYDKLLADDKSGKLRAKIDNFYKENPEQDNAYDDIVYDIFPEIRHET